jgi:hypothetical protein
VIHGWIKLVRCTQEVEEHAIDLLSDVSMRDIKKVCALYCLEI